MRDHQQQKILYSDHSSLSTFIPIRVDCIDPKIPIRVVDTVLLDPTIWPIPFYYYNGDTTSLASEQQQEQLELVLEQNTERIAHMILADSEVIGMGRTVRHFTGRLEVWSHGLFDSMKEQIYSQLKSIVVGQYYHPYRSSQRINHVMTRSSSIQQHKKHNVDDGSVQDKTEMTETKRLKIHDKNDTNETVVSKDNDSNQNANQPRDTSLFHDESSSQDNIKKNKNQPVMQPPTPILIPIQIHLLMNGIEIDDEFMYDPSVPVSFIDIAKSIGYDLNLTDEIIQGLTIEIAEQIQKKLYQPPPSQLQQQASRSTKDNMTTTDNEDDTTNAMRRTMTMVTSAQLLDPKLNYSYIQHHVTIQKPTTTMSSSTDNTLTS
jgi:hypothetical protein